MAMRRIFRSRSMTWSSGGVLNVDLSFLDAAMQAFKAPLVTALNIHARFQIDSGSSGAPGRLFPQLFDKIVVADGGVERVNLSGADLRAVLNLEYGNAWLPPRFMAASQSNTNIDVDLPIPLLPRKARRRLDYAMPVSDLLKGGRIDLYLRAGTSIGTNQVDSIDSGTIEIIAEVEEGRVPELKSRICWRSYNFTNAEDYYPVGGRLRGLWVYAGTTDENAGTVLADQNWTSYDLQITNVPAYWFAVNYHRESRPALALDTLAVAAGEDMVYQSHATTPNYLHTPRFVNPVWAPREDEKIPYMPPLQRVHLKAESGTVPTNGKIIVCSIIGRDPNLAAAVFKTTPEKLAAHLATSGKVKAVDESKPIGQFTESLRATLPMK